jgi:hypothetical protein
MPLAILSSTGQNTENRALIVMLQVETRRLGVVLPPLNRAAVESLIDDH